MAWVTTVYLLSSTIVVPIADSPQTVFLVCTVVVLFGIPACFLLEKSKVEKKTEKKI